MQLQMVYNMKQPEERMVVRLMRAVVFTYHLGLELLRDSSVDLTLV